MGRHSKNVLQGGASTYLYADVEKTFGAQMDEKYRLNIGFRYSF